MIKNQTILNKTDIEILMNKSIKVLNRNYIGLVIMIVIVILINVFLRDMDSILYINILFVVALPATFISNFLNVRKLTKEKNDFPNEYKCVYEFNETDIRLRTNNQNATIKYSNISSFLQDDKVIVFRTYDKRLFAINKESFEENDLLFVIKKIEGSKKNDKK